jgi:hypothetical protein
MIKIANSKVYQAGDKQFTDLKEAQKHALELVLLDEPAAAEVMANADEVLAILSQKPWKPRGKANTPAATPAA